MQARERLKKTKVAQCSEIDGAVILQCSEIHSSVFLQYFCIFKSKSSTNFDEQFSQECPFKHAAGCFCVLPAAFKELCSNKKWTEQILVLSDISAACA